MDTGGWVLFEDLFSFMVSQHRLRDMTRATLFSILFWNPRARAQLAISVRVEPRSAGSAGAAGSLAGIGVFQALHLVRATVGHHFDFLDPIRFALPLRERRDFWERIVGLCHRTNWPNVPHILANGIKPGGIEAAAR